MLAIASIVTVILLLEGFYSGLLTQLRNTVLNRQADLIVVQAGVSNMTAARSILPQYSRMDVEAIDGVSSAHPLTGISAIYEHDGLSTAVFLLVYDSHGGPAEIREGFASSEPRSVVVDHSLSSRYGLEVGDPFVLTGFEFRVAGVTSGAAAMFTPFVFVRFDDLIDYYLESDTAADITTFPLLSFLLLELDVDAERDGVAATIERVIPEADVVLPGSMADADEALGRALFGPTMKLLVGVGYTIGALVTGIIMFAAVNARRRELGVMKALGFSNRFLQGSVLFEGVTLSFLSLPIGVILAWFVGHVIETAAPLYLVKANEMLPVLRTSLACITFAAIGSLLPIRVIQRIEPAAAFGG